ncbi:MAG: extracellular solute-binding protein, partial [Alphaproteobacteria bacterium]|nr:extracellular solute-binding protein [Alphaproteobacteria bacterium]
MRNTRLWAWVAAFIAICAAAYFYFFNPLAPQQPTINVLAWTGYEEPQLTQAFEKATGIRVNVKTYVGGDQMYSIFSTTKNTYDAVIVDTEYLKPLHDAGRLSALEANSLNYTGYFPYFVTFPSAHFGGETFGVPVRFGVNGIV